MLIVRKGQMDAFSKYMIQNFENRMLESLKKAHPERSSAMTEAELRSLIRSGTEKAAEHGITIEYDVERFIELAVKHGADFDSQPWAADFLYKKPLDYPSETVDHLVVQAPNQPGQD